MAALCCITLLQLTHTFFLFAIFLSSFYTRKIVTDKKLRIGIFEFTFTDLYFFLSCTALNFSFICTVKDLNFLTYPYSL